MNAQATWGEFVEFAERQLSDGFVMLLETGTRSTAEQHATRSDALAGVCRLIHSYAGEFGPIAVGTITPQEAADLMLNLQHLGGGLSREATSAAHTNDRIAGCFVRAKETLALGWDLLATHHSPGREPRSPYASYLDTPEAARQFLSVTVRLADLVGATAVQLAHNCPPTPRTTRGWEPLSQRLALSATQLELIATSVLIRLGRINEPFAVDRGAAALSAAADLPPVPVRPGESQGAALLSVVRGSEWLAAHAVRLSADRVPAITPAELVTVSNRTALSHLLAARLLDHARDVLSPSEQHTEYVSDAAEKLRAAAHKWQTAWDSWGSDFLVPPTGQSIALAREAEFATVRLGRTLFSYGWTPQAPARHPRPATDIVSDPDAKHALLDAVRAVPAAGEVLAEHIPRIALALAHRRVLLSSDPAFNPHGSDLPAQMRSGWTRWYAADPAQLQPITAAYASAMAASATADAATSRAAEVLGHPIARAHLDADRRRTLGLTGDAVLDTRRVRASAAWARSVLTPPQQLDSPRDVEDRTRALRREIKEVYGTDRAQGRRR